MPETQDELTEMLLSSSDELNASIDKYESIEAQYIAAYQYAPTLPATSNTTNFPMSAASASSITP